VWPAAASLVSDATAELVNVTRSQVSSGSKSRSPLSRFIQSEVETVCQQLETVSCLVDDLERVITGQTAATPRACDALKAIAAHRVPQLPIKNTSSSCQDMAGWIRGLQQRLVNLPRADDDNCVFDMRAFSRPEGFLYAALRHLARQQFKSLHSVCLTVCDVCTTTVPFLTFL